VREHVLDDEIDGLTYCSVCGAWSGVAMQYPECRGRPDERLRAERDILTANLTACREDLARYREIVARLKKERDEAVDYRDRYFQNWNDALRERDEAKRLLAAEQEQCSRMGSDNVRRMKRLGVEFPNGLDSGIDRLESDLDSLKARLVEVEKERDELVNAVVTGPLKGKTAEQEILSLRARLEGVEGERDEARERLRVCEEQIEALGVANEENVRMRPVYEAAKAWRAQLAAVVKIGIDIPGRASADQLLQQRLYTLEERVDRALDAENEAAKAKEGGRG